MSTDADAKPEIDVRHLSLAQLQPGVRVRVRGFNKPVILRRVDGSSAEIEAGPLRMKVAIEEITGVEQGSHDKTKASPKHNITVRSSSGPPAGSGEINVIGLTVEQATELVDKFLDNAALAHRTQVRIIHGNGTGALRKGIGEFLRTHPLVEGSHFESEEQGGNAITVVDLRI